MLDLSKKAVYISGPMSGVPDYNRVAFAQAERELYDLGARFVFNPCEYWRGDGEGLPDWTHDKFMRADLHMLTSGMLDRPRFDLLVLLDGYEMSKGAVTELVVARACGIRALCMAAIMTWPLDDFWAWPLDDFRGCE